MIAVNPKNEGIFELLIDLVKDLLLWQSPRSAQRCARLG